MCGLWSWFSYSNFKMAVNESLLQLEEDKEDLPDNLLQNLLIKDPLLQKQNLQGPLAKSVIPQPGFCIKTKTDTEEKVFVNICTSQEIPSPKDISDEQLQTLLQSGDATNYRVPLSLGEPHTEKDNAGKDCSVYDVIISSSFYDTIQKRPLMKDFLLTIILEGLEDKYSLSLCRECKIMKNRKFFGQLPEQTVRGKSKPFIIEVDQKQTKSKTKRKLVSETIENESTKSPIPEPQYTIIREPVDGELPEFLVMEVQLPGVSSSRNLLLDVGEDRIVLTARPNLYHFDIDLPFLVNNEETGAQYNKDTKVLSITLPVTGHAPI